MSDFNDHFRKNQAASQEAPDLFSAAITFVGINLMWVFFALWVLFGMVPVLLLAVFINHMITRIEIRQRLAHHQS